MKKVVSVSLGSPSRDWKTETILLGEPIHIARRGVGQDYAAYTAMIARLAEDPEVSAIGMGGVNRYLVAGGRKYPLKKAEEMAAYAKGKPIVDGIGLKESLEPHVVASLAEQGILPADAKVLMVCAVDRWWMAEALGRAARSALYGDLAFALDIPFFIESVRQLEALAKLLLPVVTRHLPFEWLYPTGESKPRPKYVGQYAWADWIAGDAKFIWKRLPDAPGSLKGKTILTNTVTRSDRERVFRLGLDRLITVTPNFSGRSPGTNLIEAVIVALAGKRPEEMTPGDYLSYLKELGWDRPSIETPPALVESG
ncbi:MAG: quinate 5-dehydrogenase [Armatimonadetes bacterium]|nr:quinate 5-dehydrogenase [Armatimonadota bacterium]